MLCACLLALLQGCDKQAAAPPSTTTTVPVLDLALNTRLIEFKNRIEKDPYSADARLGLGQVLLEQGDPRSAEREFSRALELGLDASAVLPVLARTWNTLGRSRELIDTHGTATLGDAAAAAEFKAALAMAYANTGQPRKARELIDEALQQDPRSARARVLQAQVAMADGLVDEALRSIEQTLAIQPASSEALETRGDILLMARGDVPGAMASYQAALNASPRYTPIHAKLIATALEVGDLPAAKTRLAALAAAAPGSLPHLYFSARLQHATGNLSAARDGIQQALTAYPKDLRSILLGAEIELKAGAPRAAEEYLATALAMAPTLPRVRYLLARTYLRLGTPEKAQMILEPLVRARRDDPTALGLAAEAALQAGLPFVATRLFERAAAADPANTRLKAALALARIAKGDFASGIVDLENAAASDTSTFSDMALLSARLHTADLAGAIKAATALSKKQPDKPMPEWLLGRLMLKSQRLAEARQHFDRAVALDAAYVPAAISLAEMDLDANDAASARRRFEGVLAVSPNNLDALLTLAEIQYRAGDGIDKVTTALESTVKLHPTHPRAWVALVEHHMRAGASGAALLAAQRASGALPEDMTVMDALGRAQFEAGESAQALGTFRKIVSLRPRSAGPHLRMAEVYVSRNEIDSAIESFKNAVALNPDLASAQIRLTGLLAVRQNWAEALRVAAAVQRRKPRDPLGHHLEGLVHASRQQWEPAFVAFKSAAERGESAELMVQWHGALLAAGRKPEAAQLASQWLAKRPADTVFVGYLGDLALVGKDFAAAETSFRAVLKNDPANVAAMNNLAWALNEQSKPGAVDLARKAVALQPRRAEFLDTLSMALARENQMAAALDNQKKALELDPNTPGLRLTMARLAVKAGDFTMARAELDKLSALGKAFPDQSEVWQLRQQLP